jgi:hypothetical protein
MHEEIRWPSAKIDVDDETFEIGPCRAETGQESVLMRRDGIG